MFRFRKVFRDKVVNKQSGTKQNGAKHGILKFSRVYRS